MHASTLILVVVAAAVKSIAAASCIDLTHSVCAQFGSIPSTSAIPDITAFNAAFERAIRGGIGEAAKACGVGLGSFQPVNTKPMACHRVIRDAMAGVSEVEAQKCSSAPTRLCRSECEAFRRDAERWLEDECGAEGRQRALAFLPLCSDTQFGSEKCIGDNAEGDMDRSSETSDAIDYEFAMHLSATLATAVILNF